jgi:hypothetical protein
MYKRILKWFQDTFPDAKHNLNVDSAIPAVSAWYFSVSKSNAIYCLGKPSCLPNAIAKCQHRCLPQYCVLATLPEDADLIFLELDINQWPPEERGVLDNTERLFRTVLALEHKPAVIYLSVFGLVL